MSLFWYRLDTPSLEVDAENHLHSALHLQLNPLPWHFVAPFCTIVSKLNWHVVWSVYGNDIDKAVSEKAQSPCPSGPCWKLQRPAIRGTCLRQFKGSRSPFKRDLEDGFCAVLGGPPDPEQYSVGGLELRDGFVTQDVLTPDAAHRRLELCFEQCLLKGFCSGSLGPWRSQGNWTCVSWSRYKTGQRRSQFGV
jgi:hypothetical protein